MRTLRTHILGAAAGAIPFLAVGTWAADPAPAPAARGPTPAHESRAIDLAKFPMAKPGVYPSEKKAGDRLRFVPARRIAVSSVVIFVIALVTLPSVSNLPAQ